MGTEDDAIKVRQVFFRGNIDEPDLTNSALTGIPWSAPISTTTYPSGLSQSGASPRMVR